MPFCAILIVSLFLVFHLQIASHFYMDLLTLTVWCTNQYFSF
uniref:Uncharacterized protein n=1 Tax=Arundo donax TaxID=35708 RepID=A0A0A9FYU9_ARUDO